VSRMRFARRAISAYARASASGGSSGIEEGARYGTGSATYHSTLAAPSVPPLLAGLLSAAMFPPPMPSLRFACALAAASMLAACGPGGSSSPGSSTNPTPPPPSVTCPAGLTPDPSGFGCTDLSPAADCGPGTRASLGQAECQPVAMAQCPAGFVADPSGWGCADVVPAAACTGATMEQLGSPDCQPIGDCSAPFPPANATMFVSAAYGPAQLDATHYSSVAAAVQAAHSGDVVAIDSGTYTEIAYVKVPLTLVGRCAAQVTLESPGGIYSGIIAVNTKGVVVRGLTISGHRGGVSEQDGDVTVDQCLLSGNRGGGVDAVGGSIRVTNSRIVNTLQDGDQGFGAFAGQGGSIELDNTAVVGSHIAGVVSLNPGSQLKLVGSIVTGTQLDVGGDLNGTSGVGGVVADSATLLVSGSSFYGNRTANLDIYDPSTHATISDSILRDVTQDSTGLEGNGVQVHGQAQAEIDTTTIVGSAGWGIISLDKGSTFKVQGSVVRGSIAPGATELGAGVYVAQGAVGEIDGSAVVGNLTFGLHVQDPGSQLTFNAGVVRDTQRDAKSLPGDGVGVAAVYGGEVTMSDAAVVANRSAGVVVGGSDSLGGGSQANLTGVLVLRSLPDETGAFGIGIQVTDAATINLAGCAFIANQDVAIVVGQNGSQAGISDTVVRDTGVGMNTAYGYGLLVLDGASVGMSSSFFRNSLGVALAYSNAAGIVDGTLVQNNPIGIYVNGSNLEQVDALPSWPSPLQVMISSSTQFVDDATRVSSTELPLPKLVP
jgi:Right handed beta helix region